MMDKTKENINSIISSASEIWHNPSFRKERLLAIEWLKTEYSSEYPFMVRTISESLCLPYVFVIFFIRTMENAEYFNMLNQLTVKPFPLSGLQVWHKATTLYRRRQALENSTSETDRKIIYGGEYYKNGCKHHSKGLLSVFNNDAFEAFAGYYIITGDMGIVHRRSVVRLYCEWSIEYIDMITTKSYLEANLWAGVAADKVIQNILQNH
jgi:hypothetical protein